MTKILLVDDDSDFASATQTLLEVDGHAVGVAATVEEASSKLQSASYDLLLVDIALPDGSGLEVIEKGGPPAIVITGHPSVETAIRAVKGPVIDYLVKPLDRATLSKAIDQAAPRQTPNRSVHPVALQQIAGESSAMQQVRQQIADFGPLDETVLIIGESGTGKELVARALHACRETEGSLITVNCGAIAPELIASELFGHEKGAFTGAASVRKGVFESAGDGTVFLDEIGELPMEQQVALLRVLENRSVTRVGSAKARSVQARVVAATNQQLETMVREGRFREDLFFRLMVLRIDVPPLRERQGDVAILARFFAEQMASEYGSPAALSNDVLDRLENYDWPGNVRELRHTLLRAAIQSRGHDSVDELPSDFGRPLLLGNDPDSIKPGMAIRDVERILIAKTLKHFDGNRKDTAAALGVSLKTLYNRLREYEDRGIDLTE